MDKIPNRKYIGWEIDWKCIYQFISNMLQNKTLQPHYTTKLVQNTFKSYTFQIVNKVKKHFTANAGIEIFDQLKVFLQPYKDDGVSILCMLLPTHRSVPMSVILYYYHDLMAYWYMTSGISTSNNALMMVMCEIAYSHYNIDWTPHYNFIFTQIFRILELPLSPKMSEMNDNMYAIVMKGDPINSGAKLIANIIRNSKIMSRQHRSNFGRTKKINYDGKGLFSH